MNSPKAILASLGMVAVLVGCDSAEGPKDADRNQCSLTEGVHCAG